MREKNQIARFTNNEAVWQTALSVRERNQAARSTESGVLFGPRKVAFLPHSRVVIRDFDFL